MRVPASDVEVVAAELLERFPAGLEEAAYGEFVELAVYADADAERELLARFPDVTVSPVPVGWEERWKEFHRPAWAADIWIGPPWIERPAERKSVVVDPGRAFGTGAHPTTRAAIEALASVRRGGLLDAGCGSGVIAVAAVLLGFRPVDAVDLDPVAVEVTRETARVNGVALDVRQADVLADALPSTDVLVANIELRVVEALLERATARTAITSGYYLSDRPDASGWRHVQRVELEGWAADVWAGRH